MSAALPLHPGPFIRDTILPREMSVTKAADLLGVGRPALSNLLNGNSRLSKTMATRLEKAFGVRAGDLLEMQARFDEHAASQQAGGIAVRRHVPHYLRIAALEIERWTDSVAARSELPVLLRKLIHTTSADIEEIDFPGYDNAQRHGWDGFADARASTPWIPAGRSGWEFGTNQDPARKARDDYAARTAEIPEAERREITYIAVTPRNWPGKRAWAEDRRAAREWKDVRAYDASDLEQWLEQSIPVQSWIAWRMGRATEGVQSLDECWSAWSGVTEPNLSPALFEPAVAQHTGLTELWLGKEPQSPLTITADSPQEALAFLHCLFQAEKLRAHADRVVVFRTPASIKSVAMHSSDVIAVVAEETAEREIGALRTKLHTIISRPKNVPADDPDIALDLLPYTPFEKALDAMGIDRGRIETLHEESGGSLTVLRRRLSDIPAIRNPSWAADEQAGTSLVALALLGTWNIRADADQNILKLIANVEDVELIHRRVVRLSQLEEPPVWSVATYQGVVSKVDALYGVARWVTESDLDRFFRAALIVLSEDDPALDLPEDQRWAAGMYGKTREHSAALRAAICETLVVLAVHGTNLFGRKLAKDVPLQVERTISKLLTPLTPRLLDSQSRDLPRFAEAAPDFFLRLIEEDLKSANPKVLTLLRPVGDPLFSSCPRTGLLWALETLAWNPEYLPRVTLILGRLAEEKIDDRWSNRPDGSLEDIFRSWMPQTAASVEKRIAALDLLVRRYPRAGWSICVDQIRVGSQTGTYTVRPKFRPDSFGAGQTVTIGERRRFALHALETCLAWADHDDETLGDLVTNLPVYADYQDRVWKLVDEWAEREINESKRAALRETIRRTCLTRRGRLRRRDNAEEGVDVERARLAIELLTPRDLITRHRWLFDRQWVEWSADDLEANDFNPRDHERRVGAARREAAREVFDSLGFEGIWSLAAPSEAPGVVSWSLAETLTDSARGVAFVMECIRALARDENVAISLLYGFLRAGEGERRRELTDAVLSQIDLEQTVSLMLALPFEEVTWRRLDTLDSSIRDLYWRRVRVGWAQLSPDELRTAVDALRSVGRPLAAFHLARFEIEHLDSERIVRLLEEAAATASAAESDKLDPHSIAGAFKLLDARRDIELEKLVRLEFIYFEALERTEHNAPNVQRAVAESPAIFVEALVRSFRRRDDKEDPPQYRIKDEEERGRAAQHAYHVLDRQRRIPGTDDEGRIDEDKLRAWVREARRLAKELSREEICDSQIGQLLARSPADEDGVWPCAPVRNVLEELASAEIGRALYIGVYNDHQGGWRGEGGEQERQTAARYRLWADRLSSSTPYVASVLSDIARNYERDAAREDDEASIRRRIRR